MNPSRISRTRLLLVVGVALALAGAYGGVRIYRAQRVAQGATEARETGRKALAAGDYETALDRLGTYILHASHSNAVTADDYLQYAKARRKVELPHGQHLADAISMLRKARQLEPASRPVEDELLGLYVATGYATEALELLDLMLGVSPSDLELLTTKCDLLDAMRQFGKALEVARRIHELQPNDFAGPVRTLRLMILANTPAPDVDLWLAAVTAAHPNDPRFDLLKAAAYARRNEMRKASDLLDGVVASVLSSKDKDPRFLALLLGELDTAGRYDDAMKIVEGAEDTADPVLRREGIRRLWYLDRFDDLVARTDRWKAERAGLDPEIPALKAAALIALGRGAEAAPIRAELAKRSDDAGKAWATYLTFVSDEPAARPAAPLVMGDALRSYRPIGPSLLAVYHRKS